MQISNSSVLNDHYLIIILLLVIIYLYGCQLLSTSCCCKKKITENFYSSPSVSRASFTMFGVDWCPHCVSTKPKFEELGSRQTIGKCEVEFKYVNPEKDIAAAQGYEIEGYPTFYLEKAGKKIKYTGSRDSVGIISFLQKELSL